MITKERAEELSHLLLQNKITDEEESELQTWYNENLEDPFVVPESFVRSKTEHSRRMLKAINAAISARSTLRLWPKIAIAAALATMMVSIGIWFLKKNVQHQVVLTSYAADITPGKMGATLTLGNGKKIVLSDVTNGELAKESGVVIIKAANGSLKYEIKEQHTIETDKINTLSTAKGETYQVKLPDGTSVWLNAASTLKYPASFATLKSRNVELTGEAYFQVAKDKSHPFIVKTAKQQVEVLGTHFSVNSYEDELVTKTTLEEGSVKVSNGPTEKMLKPGQQSVLNRAGLMVSEADLEEELAWKNGYFRFNAEKIESIMRKIARWYNIEIVYEGKMPENGLYGKVSRSKNISQVLTVLELTKLVHFKIEGRKLLVIAN